MSLRTFDGEQIILRTIDGQTLYDIIEDDVIITHGEQSTTNQFQDGTLAMPSISFIDDANLGFYRIGPDNLGISTGGVLGLNLSSALATFSGDLRLQHRTGNPQLEFGRQDGLYNLEMYVNNADNNFIINQRSGSSTVNILTPSGGGVIIQPESVSTTNIDFDINIGNLIDYTTLFCLSENRIQSTIPIRTNDGLNSAPSYSFINDIDSGLFLNGIGNLALSCGSFNVLDISQSNVDIVTTQVLCQPLTVLSTTFDFLVRVGDGISAYTNLFHIDEIGTTFSQAQINVNSDCKIDNQSGEYILFNSALEEIEFYTQSAIQFEIRDDFIVSHKTHVFINGTVSDPSFAFASSSNTGMFLTGTDDIGVTNNGTETFEFGPTETIAHFPLRTASYTIASLPTAVAGRIVFCTDETGGAVLLYADGTNWRRVTDGAIAS